MRHRLKSIVQRYYVELQPLTLWPVAITTLFAWICADDARAAYQIKWRGENTLIWKPWIALPCLSPRVLQVWRGIQPFLNARRVWTDWHRGGGILVAELGTVAACVDL